MGVNALAGVFFKHLLRWGVTLLRQATGRAQCLPDDLRRKFLSLAHCTLHTGKRAAGNIIFPRTFNTSQDVSQDKNWLFSYLCPHWKSQPQIRKRENKGYCLRFSCHIYPFPSTSPLLASLCAKRRSRLLDDGRRPPLTWEIKPITGGQERGEGLNQQHTFLLPARLAVLCALITQSSKTFTPILPSYAPTVLHSPFDSKEQPANTHTQMQSSTCYLYTIYVIISIQIPDVGLTHCNMGT